MKAPAAMFRYAERQPSAAVAPWVLSLWSFQADATPPADEPYTVWPDGCVSVGLVRDARMRILGPLDALLWDRSLVRTVFGFDYSWEVYKPKEKRRFGWYVCPLLHRGQLVGRLEGKVDGTTLVVDRIWREKHHELDEDALDACLERHATACRCDAVKRPKVRVAR